MDSIIDQVLHEHRDYSWRLWVCQCGQRLPDHMPAEAGHVRHVAEMTEDAVRDSITRGEP